MKIITRKSDIWSLGIITFMMLKNKKVENDCRKYYFIKLVSLVAKSLYKFLVKTLEFNFYKNYQLENV